MARRISNSQIAIFLLTIAALILIFFVCFFLVLHSSRSSNGGGSANEINVSNGSISPSFMGHSQPPSEDYSCNLIGNIDWIDLSTTIRSAAVSLGYDECSWKFPPYNNKLEYWPWSYLGKTQQENAKILGCNEYSWNSKVNHFNGVSWDDLYLYGVKKCAEGLGYSQLSWDGNSTDEPPALESWWKNLTQLEKTSARCLGYSKKTWNGAYVCKHKVDFDYTQSLQSDNFCAMAPYDGRGDRIGHAIALLQGEFICSRNGRYRFGMDESGSLIWIDNDENNEIILFKGENGYSFALSMNADLVIYDQNQQPVWSISCVNEVHFSEKCLVNPSFYYDCPYLHLHSDGVVALNYLENGYDDDIYWGEVNIKNVYLWVDGVWD